MAERTEEQILDEAVYAVACVARHYGPGFNERGLAHVRELLSQVNFSTDSCFRVDVYEDDEFVDFHQRIVWPEDWDSFTIKDMKVEP